ncbi:MAG: prepilin-type N-terminal cleavage/methylation domain-containing protein [Syntrophorhabdaceae bacterium]|nr:prepilin-type N-terminal cleavage/methylation domain-containing protein [Syntrophorhabdaceae bacterium]MDD5244614.1 prepilin-type N-terminal cleavage/methylation domain-containing protein [Syntrophorhabdaceae bacterium]
MRTNNKGFTLIELIIFIIIGAIFLPVSFVAFTSVMNNYSRPDYYMKAMFYADKRMAEITNNPYVSILPNVPIPPTGLSCSDAFPPTTFTAEAAPDAGYTTGCVIESINPNLSTTTPNPNYKRITVTVKYSGLLSDYTISTIVTRRPNS